MHHAQESHTVEGERNGGILYNVTHLSIGLVERWFARLAVDAMKRLIPPMFQQLEEKLADLTHTVQRLHERISELQTEMAKQRPERFQILERPIEKASIEPALSSPKSVETKPVAATNGHGEGKAREEKVRRMVAQARKQQVEEGARSQAKVARRGQSPRLTTPQEVDALREATKKYLQTHSQRDLGNQVGLAQATISRFLVGATPRDPRKLARLNEIVRSG